jgi:hypothetical protein
VELMASEPDLRFDIDALFDHMIQNLDHDLSDEKDWCFLLESADSAKLREVAAEMEGGFDIQFAEPMETTDGSNGSPALAQLTLIQRAALTASEVKATAESVKVIANAKGLQYEGVSCYDPVDAEDLLDWMPPEDATWRLRVMSDSGLPPNAELPWTFLVVMPSVDALHRVTEALQGEGYTDIDLFDEPDENGVCGLCLFVAGRNVESALSAEIARIAHHAETCGGELQGVQFYDRDEFDEVFGDEPADEE